MSITFKRHAPGYCTFEDEFYAPIVIEDEYIKNLTKIIERFVKDPQFYRLSIEKYQYSPQWLLVAEMDEGKKWWVTGYLNKDIPELPRWEPKK